MTLPRTMTIMIELGVRNRNRRGGTEYLDDRRSVFVTSCQPGKRKPLSKSSFLYRRVGTQMRGKPDVIDALRASTGVTTSTRAMRCVDTVGKLATIFDIDHIARCDIGARWLRYRATATHKSPGQQNRRYRRTRCMAHEQPRRRNSSRRSNRHSSL